MKNNRDASVVLVLLEWQSLPLQSSLPAPPPAHISQGQVETFKILSADSNVNSRAFASAHPLHDDYIVCFSRRERRSPRYDIFCQEFENLRSGTPAALSPEFLALRARDADATKHIYIPYLFERSEGFGMVFTARGTKELATDEWIGLAESANGRDWAVTVPRAFEASLDWEANDVENFGLLRHDGRLWMNYESTGPTGLRSNRSIGIAYSLDHGKSWERAATKPALTGGVYCAGFFVHEDSVYLIAAA